MNKPNDGNILSHGKLFTQSLKTIDELTKFTDDRSSRIINMILDSSKENSKSCKNLIKSHKWVSPSIQSTDPFTNDNQKFKTKPCSETVNQNLDLSNRIENNAKLNPSVGLMPLEPK